jgi:hypothetical protein
MSRIRRNHTVIGAPGGSRTPNLLIRSQMLYPLSYRRGAISLPTQVEGQDVWRRRQDSNL